jgi:16S rRNA (cytidine1402-2'-O)-methyltransferase
MLEEAVLVVAADEVRKRLERLGVPEGVRALSPAEPGPAHVAAVVQEVAGGPVAWAVLRVGRWTAAERAVLCALLAAGIEVLPVPGGASWIGCLAASGLPGDRFTFLGPMPIHGAARRVQLARVGVEQHTLIWQLPAEALPAALRDAATLLGNRSAALCSTDGIWRGRLDDAPAGPADAVLIVEGAGEEPAWTEERVRACVRRRLVEGASTRDVARQVADASGWPRRRVYDVALEIGAE